MVRSVRNRCLDYLKSQYHQREIQMSDMSCQEINAIDYLQDECYPLGHLLENELEIEIMKAINRLPEECCKIFWLNRFSGLKYDEIANQLGISVSTVKYHIRRALELLTKDLGQYDSQKAYALFKHRIARKQNEQKRRNHMHRFWYAAASIVVLLIISSLIYIGAGTHTKQTIADVVIETPIGSRTRLTLPDGTTV